MDGLNVGTFGASGPGVINGTEEIITMTDGNPLTFLVDSYCRYPGFTQEFNAIVSELVLAMRSLGHVYDPERFDNLAQALQRLAPRSISQVINCLPNLTGGLDLPVQGGDTTAWPVLKFADFTIDNPHDVPMVCQAVFSDFTAIVTPNAAASFNTGFGLDAADGTYIAASEISNRPLYRAYGVSDVGRIVVPPGGLSGTWTWYGAASVANCHVDSAKGYLSIQGLEASPSAALAERMAIEPRIDRKRAAQT